MAARRQRFGNLIGIIAACLAILVAIPARHLLQTHPIATFATTMPRYARICDVQWSASGTTRAATMNFAASARSTPMNASGGITNGNRIRSRSSDVNARGKRILLDELAARLYHVAHQLREDLVGFGKVADLDL